MRMCLVYTSQERLIFLDSHTIGMAQEKEILESQKLIKGDFGITKANLGSSALRDHSLARKGENIDSKIF